MGNSATFLVCTTVGVSLEIFWARLPAQTQPNEGPHENGVPGPAVALDGPA